MTPGPGQILAQVGLCQRYLITSWLRVFNPKAIGIGGRAPGMGCGGQSLPQTRGFMESGAPPNINFFSEFIKAPDQFNMNVEYKIDNILKIA